MRVELLRVGCEVHGLHLPTAQPSEKEFVQLATALLQHGLVVLRGQEGLRPEHEVALYRRLGSIWTDGPLPLEATESAAAWSSWGSSR